MIHIYTGSGKGKTTAALGLALRACGAGLKVYIGQFNKGKRCSEHRALRKLRNIEVEQFGTPRFIKTPTSLDKKKAEAGFNKVKRIIRSNKFDMIILDEITVAIKLGLLDCARVISALKKASQKTELILTGRDAPGDLIGCADLVSEIKEIKHYFKKGILARRGIEF